MTVSDIDLFLWVKNKIEITCTYDTTTAHTVRVQLIHNSEILTEGFYNTRDGVAVIDIAGYAKELIDLTPDDRLFSDATVARGAETLRRMYIRVINDENTVEYYAEHYFIYGEKLISDTIDFQDYYFADQNTGTTLTHFMTEFARPKMFKGYPFEMRYGSYNSTGLFDGFLVGIYFMDRTDTLFIVQDVEIDNYFSAYIVKIKLFEDTPVYNDRIEWIILAGGNEYIYPQIVDYVKDICPGGVYLRWINRFGGVDQYYFYLKDTKNPVKTTVVDQIKKIGFTNNHNAGIGKVVSKDYAIQYVIGADGVSTDDFKAISAIMKSDRVDMYMSGNKWMQVIVSDADFTIDHSKDYHDIEFTITAE